MINWFKKESKVLKKIFKAKTLVIAFAILAVVLVTSISMAGWVDDNGTDSNEVIYTDPATGKVGIGTNNPDLNFEVSSTGTAFMGVSSTASGDAYLLLDAQDGDFTGGDYGVIVQQNDGAMVISNGGGSIAVKSQGKEVMRIQPSGYVGIGAWDPELNLTVRTENTNAFMGVAARGTGDAYLLLDAQDGNFTGGHYSAICQQNNGFLIIANGISQPIELKINGKKYVHISNNGNVGIGTTTPSSKLDISGTTTSSNYACSSDIRYKKNIFPYQNALQKVLGLQGVNYFWKADEYKDKGFSKDRQIGFIAQEVEKVIPELVYTDDKGFKTMSYDRLTAVLVEAVKELNAKSEAKISALEKENAELKQRLVKVDALAERLAVLEKAAEKDKLALK